MYKRSGDHYFIAIDEKDVPKNLKKIKHGKTFVFGTGEASNHHHIIVADRENVFDIMRDEAGTEYYQIKGDVKLMHTVGNSLDVADHKTITQKPGWYVHVPEREVDIFSKVVRKTVD